MIEIAIVAAVGVFVGVLVGALMSGGSSRTYRDFAAQDKDYAVAEYLKAKAEALNVASLQARGEWKQQLELADQRRRAQNVAMAREQEDQS